MSATPHQGGCPFSVDASGQDVHGEIRRLREHGRAVRVALPGGVPTWMLLDQALIKQLLTDDRVSRDTYQHWPEWGNGESELARTWPLALWVADRNMITAYGSDHKRLRKIVAKEFTARRTAALEPRIRALTEELLTNLAAVEPGEVVDLRAEFAYPLPMRVISELLGITGDLRDDLLRCVHAILDTTASSEAAKKNELELYELLRELVDGKRRSPSEDLISGLLSNQDNGESLSEQELLDTILLMFTAGHETTVNLIDHAIFHMLVHPEFLSLVRGKELTWDHVIEETLRVEAPFGNLPLRYAVKDIDLGDVRIAKGETMTVSFAGAGRDEQVHGEDADRFDPFRETRTEHISFGHGVHHCLGAPLARLESRIGLSRLFEEFPDMELGVSLEGIRPLESFISNGHRSLPVILRPEARAGDSHRKQERKNR